MTQVVRRACCAEASGFMDLQAWAFRSEAPRVSVGAPTITSQAAVPVR